MSSYRRYPREFPWSDRRSLVYERVPSQSKAGAHPEEDPAPMAHLDRGRGAGRGSPSSDSYSREREPFRDRDRDFDRARARSRSRSPKDPHPSDALRTPEFRHGEHSDEHGRRYKDYSGHGRETRHERRADDHHGLDLDQGKDFSKDAGGRDGSPRGRNPYAAEKIRSEIKLPGLDLRSEIHPGAQGRYSLRYGPPKAPPAAFSHGMDSRRLNTNVCFVCGGIGHYARDCPSNPEAVMKATMPFSHPPAHQRGFVDSKMGLHEDSAFPKCFHCGKKGHLSRECWHKQEKGVMELRCYNCNSTGHLLKDCPNKQGMYPSGVKGGKHPNPSGYPHQSPLHPPANHPPHPHPYSHSGDPVCYNCGGIGHFARNCSEKLKGGFGFDRGAPSKPASQVGLLSEPLLFGSKLGHPSALPPPSHIPGGFRGYSPAVAGGGFPPHASTPNCYFCNLPGHFSRSCPFKYRRQDEKKFPSPFGFDDPDEKRVSKMDNNRTHLEEKKLDHDLDDYMKHRTLARETSAHGHAGNSESTENDFIGI